MCVERRIGRFGERTCIGFSYTVSVPDPNNTCQKLVQCTRRVILQYFASSVRKQSQITTVFFCSLGRSFVCCLHLLVYVRIK